MDSRSDSSRDNNVCDILDLFNLGNFKMINLICLFFLFPSVVVTQLLPRRYFLDQSKGEGTDPYHQMNFLQVWDQLDIVFDTEYVDEGYLWMVDAQMHKDDSWFGLRDILSMKSID